MIDKKFFKPVTIDSWLVVVYERPGRFEQREVDDMVNGLMSAAKDVGERR